MRGRARRNPKERIQEEEAYFAAATAAAGGEEGIEELAHER